REALRASRPPLLGPAVVRLRIPRRDRHEALADLALGEEGGRVARRRPGDAEPRRPRARDRLVLDEAREPEELGPELVLRPRTTGDRFGGGEHYLVGGHEGAVERGSAAAPRVADGDAARSACGERRP